MVEVIGVRFKKTGRVYYFDPAGLEIVVNDCVVVDTVRGLELGYVTTPRKQVEENGMELPLKAVIRKATPEDIQRAAEFTAKEKDALTECADMVEKMKLPMRLLAAEYNLDGSHLTFFFTAEERVDFRKLVRELTRRFKARVELRQIGSRDESKLLGGFGRCGRPLCCASFLTEFNPVSIRMAKDQSLSLNPMRISGCCGRLLCCLGYESEFYKTMKEKMPREGQHVQVPDGPGIVVGLDALKESVMVQLESGAAVEVPLKDVKVVAAAGGS
jgi:cell fate regulator YaaT (PSP1 superfamily)